MMIFVINISSINKDVDYYFGKIIVFRNTFIRCIRGFTQRLRHPRRRYKLSSVGNKLYILSNVGPTQTK